MNMSDAEFWGVLAETINGAGCLPDYAWTYVSCEGRSIVIRCECLGLCETIDYALRRRIIDLPQLVRLERQLRTKYSKRRSAYFWKPGAIAPRVRACRELMNDCLRRAA